MSKSTCITQKDISQTFCFYSHIPTILHNHSKTALLCNIYEVTSLLLPSLPCWGWRARPPWSQHWAAPPPCPERRSLACSASAHHAGSACCLSTGQLCRSKSHSGQQVGLKEGKSGRKNIHVCCAGNIKKLLATGNLEEVTKRIKEICHNTVYGGISKILVLWVSWT